MSEKHTELPAEGEWEGAGAESSAGESANGSAGEQEEASAHGNTSAKKPADDAAGALPPQNADSSPENAPKNAASEEEEAPADRAHAPDPATSLLTGEFWEKLNNTFEDELRKLKDQPQNTASNDSPFVLNFQDFFDQEFIERLQAAQENGEGIDMMYILDELRKASDKFPFPVDINIVNQNMFHDFGPFGPGFMNPPSSNEGEIDKNLVKTIALDSCDEDTKLSTEELEEAKKKATEALFLSELWLNENTTFEGGNTPPSLISRIEWILASIDSWIELHKPVIDWFFLDEETFEAAANESESSFLISPRFMRDMGAKLLSMQLGCVIGKVAKEVFSSGDTGIPVLPQNMDQGVLVPENLYRFAKEFEQNPSDIAIYFATEELAHSRLFQNNKWLRSQLLEMIRSYSLGLKINPVSFIDFDFNMNEADEEFLLYDLLKSGEFAAEPSEKTKAVLARLEHLLTLVESWVDSVTAQTVQHIASAPAIEEMSRRRKVTEGPIRFTFAIPLGRFIELKQVRKARAMWDAVREELGQSYCDMLWAHPDILPTPEEIEQPEKLIARLRSQHSEEDASDFDLDSLDREIEDFFKQVEEEQEAERVQMAAGVAAGVAGEKEDSGESKRDGKAISSENAATHTVDGSSANTEETATDEPTQNGNSAEEDSPDSES